MNKKPVNGARMKKTVITLMIFLLTSIATSNAQAFFSESTDNTTTTAPAGSGETSGEYTGGLFKASTDDPGGRPDNGGGIGQNSPIGDGWQIVVGGCIVLMIVKTVNEKRKSKNLV